jgi:hypothetical protein
MALFLPKPAGFDPGITQMTRARPYPAVSSPTIAMPQKIIRLPGVTIHPIPPRVAKVAALLHTKEIPLIVWGETAMRHYDIPTVVVVCFHVLRSFLAAYLFFQRDDMVVPSSRLADAERVLLASGWIPATSSLPGPRCPFKMIGFESLQAASKRFVHPQEDDKTELLLLPTSYVGLEGSTPGIPQLQLLSGYVNAYIPSLELLATSFTYTALHSADSGTYCRLQTSRGPRLTVLM